jgi:hypothetical protein
MTDTAKGSAQDNMNKIAVTVAAVRPAAQDGIGITPILCMAAAASAQGVMICVSRVRSTHLVLDI